MKAISRKIYYIPKEDYRNFKEKSILAYLDEMYDISYDGDNISINNKWYCNTSTTVQVPQDNFIIVKTFRDRMPDVEVFGPPSITSNRYPLWVYLAWSRSRITDNLDKYDSIVTEKRKESPIYEIYDDKIKLFYTVSFDDDFNLITENAKKGYCCLSHDATNIDTANAVRELLLKGIKGHEWLINVLGDPDNRYDLITKAIVPFESRLSIEDKLNAINMYIIKGT